jgi:tetratricopeptide (TPR) repeat protein
MHQITTFLNLLKHTAQSGLSLKISIGLFIIALPFYASAQEKPATENGEQTSDKIERIEVTANYGDAALQAFNSGNFELAEVEFKKNAKCALRAERNKQAGINGLINSQINQNMLANQTSNSSSQFSESSSGNISASSISQSARSNNDQNEVLRKSTCNNRGFQLYMMGMSQIQLGRAEEAEKNFNTAVVLNKNLYDAHHRLALMKLLREDVDGAEDELSSIKSMLNRCFDCDARDKILARVDFLEKALDGKIKLR